VISERIWMTTVVNFYSPYSGFCESKIFGVDGGNIKELGNFIFALISAIIPIAGLIQYERAKHKLQIVSYVYYIGYSLLLSYCITKAFLHATLYNGAYLMMSLFLGEVQCFCLLLLIETLCTKYFNHSVAGKILLALTFILTFYPMSTTVGSLATTNPWPSWLIFDGLWIAFVPTLVLLLHLKIRVKYLDPNDKAFQLIFYMCACVVIAYVCWLIDEYLCNDIIVGFYFHGWWQIVIVTAFYYMLTFVAYIDLLFTSHSSSVYSSASPKFSHWPKNFIIFAWLDANEISITEVELH